MEIPNSVRYFQRLNKMIKELAKEAESEKKGEKMRLTKEEKEICKKYRKRDENNTVHCYECPLVINRAWTLCKANCRAEEWEERKEDEQLER